jgi:anti-sigma B factor antagonist
MKIQLDGDTLRVADVKELAASTSRSFMDAMNAAMKEQGRNVDFDMAETVFVDSCGLGALVALQKTAAERNGTVKLLRPRPAVRQILRLSRMHRLMEVAD